MKITTITSCFKLVLIVLASLAKFAPKQLVNYKATNSIRKTNLLLCSFKTKYVTFSIDRDGNLKGIERKSDHLNLQAVGQAAPLLQIRVAGRIMHRSRPAGIK